MFELSMYGIVWWARSYHAFELFRLFFVPCCSRVYTVTLSTDTYSLLIRSGVHASLFLSSPVMAIAMPSVVPSPPLYGLLLLGGLSSRMGTDKASLLWRDRPLSTRHTQHAAVLRTALHLAARTPSSVQHFIHLTPPHPRPSTA